MRLATPALALLALLLMTATLRMRAARHVEAAPAPVAETPADAVSPANDREAVSLALLAAIGNTQPTAGIVTEVVTWSIAEDGGDGAMNRNNPWNTTMCGFNMLGSINGDGACGVGHYATMADGIAANATTLMQSDFADVRAALLANDVESFKQALWASPWAASHYGYGAAWPAYQRTSGTKAPVTDTMAVRAYYGSTDCATWGFQQDCRHWGTDFIGAEGDPVYAPFDLMIIDIGEYGPGPTWGQYVQGTFADGSVFYAGHLQGRPAMRVGETLPAGTVIGYMNAYAHTHVQFAPPGNTGACAQDGSCLDFELYWMEH